MIPIRPITQQRLNARLCLGCFVAATVGLSVAWISIGKFVLFIAVLALLTSKLFSASDRTEMAEPVLPVWTTRMVLVVLAIFSISLLWTTAQTNDSVGSVAKYGKLLTVVLLGCLLRSRQEVLYALTAFVAGQTFLVISSWMLFFGIPVPWATSRMATTQFAVFSTYLDQAIMSATAAAVCWHLRLFAPGRYGRYVAICVALICLANVLFVLIGRSGHVVAIVLLSLAVMWELPRRFKWLVITLPLVFLLIFSATSQKVQNRVEMVKSEVSEFSVAEGADLRSGTSSGIRLHFWHRSLQSIHESPFIGSGVGSWSNEYNRLEKQNKADGLMVGDKSNPHQEYLMWGVQLGVPGVLLFLALLVSIFKDTVAMETHAARATQSCLLALATSCLFNSSIYDAQIGDFFCVVIGLLLALGRYPATSTQTRVRLA